MNVAVEPRLLRTGIATTLLDTLITRVGADARLTLEVRPTNTAGIALYRRFGFLPAGRRPRYYPAGDDREDALVMTMELQPDAG